MNFVRLYDSEALDDVERTMMRVRRNIERIVDTLAHNGFRFGFYPDEEEVPAYSGPLIPPAADVDATVQQIESRIGGPIPLSIYGFWKWVGSVSLVGYYDGWPDYTDPLWIEAPEITLDELDDEPPFELILAPDFYHKDNVSGGPPYVMPVPNPSIDGTLRNLPRDCSFIDYLREAVSSCGFPGVRRTGAPLPNWLTRISGQLETF